MNARDRLSGPIPGAFPTELPGDAPIYHELSAPVPRSGPADYILSSRTTGPVDWQLPSVNIPNGHLVTEPEELLENGTATEYATAMTSIPSRGPPPKSTTYSGGRIPKSPRKSGSSKTSSSDGLSKRVVIAVFGLTGTGKSSFISRLTGHDLAVGHGLKSCTSEIQEVTFRLGSRNVTMIDTPGFDDTHRSDTEVLKDIADWMEHAYEQKVQLAGVIYLHRITDVRMTSTSLKNLRLLRKLCGTSSLGNVMLASTMWDRVIATDGEKREKELLDEKTFWGQLRENGASVWRYKNTQEDAVALIEDLARRSPVFLRIQRELGGQGKSLLQTSAGQSVLDNLDEIKQKHTKEIEELRREMAQDRTKLEDQLQLQQELQDLHKKVEEVEESKRRLAMPRTRRKWWQRNWRCVKCNVKLTKDRDDPEEWDCLGCGYRQKFV